MLEGAAIFNKKSPRRSSLTRPLNLHTHTGCNWLTFKQRSTYKTLNIIHTAIYNNLPKYISDSIKLKEITKLRSSNSNLLKHNPSTNYSSLWNKLPKTITNEKLSTTFKTKLHRHLLELN